MKRTLWLLAPVLMVSCQEMRLDSPGMETATMEKIPTAHTIPIDSAISNLNALMKGAMRTRSNDEYEISDVFPILVTHQTTRSSTSDTYPLNSTDTLLYVANFVNDKGYAILSATDLIPENVIAVIDSGRLSQDAVRTAISIIENGKPILDEYPLTGDGIYTIESLGDQKFINPNTIDFNNLASNDTLVGNFIRSSINNTHETERFDEYADIFTSIYCIEYGMKSRDIILADRDKHPMNPGDNFSGSIIEGGDGYGAADAFKEYSEWQTIASVKPLLTRYSRWRQTAPFNNKCPVLFGKRLYAGCFPLAIAKILTFYRLPYSFSYNNEYVIWNELDYYNHYTGSFRTEVGNRSAAILLYGIGKGCGSWYLPEGTFTWPSDATDFLGSRLNKRPKKLNFSFDRCKDMLSQRKPIIIYAIPSKWKIWNSHAWNIDGYRIDQRIVTYYAYVNSKKTVLSEKVEKSEMLHCDFGWSGRCNGYYVSGIFKSYYEGTEFDYDDSPGTNFNYNHYVHIIAY